MQQSQRVAPPPPSAFNGRDGFVVVGSSGVLDGFGNISFGMVVGYGWFWESWLWDGLGPNELGARS